MRYGSLFSGIGGFDLAFNMAGMECAWMCEIDKNCQIILKRHNEGVKIYGDVKEIGSGAGSVDLICGGFPCQDLSVAGKRKGLAGERSGLWYEFARIIDLLEPKWVVIENVPGLLSSNGGRDFAVIIRWLVERGYGVSWRVFDSRHFGVAQRRRRVFIVASFGTGRCAQVLFEPESTPRDTAKSRKARQETTGDPARSTQGQRNIDAFPDPAYAVQGVGTKFGSGRHNQDTFIAYSPFSHYGYENAEQSATLQDRENRINGSTNLIFQQNTRDEVRLIDGDGQIAGAVASQPGVKQQNYLAFNSRQDPITSEISPPIGAMDKGHGVIARESGHGYWMEDDKSGTIDNIGDGHYDRPALVANTNDKNSAGVRIQINADKAVTLQGLGGGMSAKTGMYTTNKGVRRLTPTECERLQAFPDGWTDGQADSIRYRQLGNAVTVSVVYWIAKRIMEVENASASADNIS